MQKEFLNYFVKIYLVRVVLDNYDIITGSITFYHFVIYKMTAFCDYNHENKYSKLLSINVMLQHSSTPLKIVFVIA
jgi:hypothetical protein